MLSRKEMLWDKYTAYQICDEFDECGREADICGRDMDCYNCDIFYELAELAEAGEIDLRDPEKERKALEDLERMCGGHFILR